MWRLHEILRSPYYTGSVVWNGVESENGRHEPLNSRDPFLQVQVILEAHATAGDNQRKHNHYLRGSIFCE